MSNLRISLDDWHELARNDDPVDIADNDVNAAAQWVAIMFEDENHPQLSKTDTMREHPELVAGHARAHAINRFEHTYRTLKIEELRLLKSIAASLESIASAAESSKGKSNE